ncbi:MAG: TRL-like family protein [Elusimicrobia bacterium]|nr:TRL-like family protein [Elusimicrobiota bacterium]
MKKVLALTAVAVMLTACTMPSSYLGYSLIAQTVEPTNVTGNTGTKTGKACGTNILSIFSSGDMSVEAAKANGKIKTVATVDREITNYVVYAKVCTVVTGS